MGSMMYENPGHRFLGSGNGKKKVPVVVPDQQDLRGNQAVKRQQPPALQNKEKKPDPLWKRALGLWWKGAKWVGGKAVDVAKGVGSTEEPARCREGGC